jgi:hypothetical protein
MFFFFLTEKRSGKKRLRRCFGKFVGFMLIWLIRKAIPKIASLCGHGFESKHFHLAGSVM